MRIFIILISISLFNLSCSNFENKSRSLASLEIDKTISWNECEGESFTANFMELKCHNRRAINNNFLKFLNDNLPSCVERASVAMNLGESVLSFHISHEGTSSNNKQEARYDSYTKAAKSIKIRSITLKLADGKEMLVKHHNVAKLEREEFRKEKAFYHELRNCYGEKQLERSGACEIFDGRSLVERKIGYKPFIASKAATVNYETLQLIHPVCDSGLRSRWSGNYITP